MDAKSQGIKKPEDWNFWVKTKKKMRFTNLAYQNSWRKNSRNSKYFSKIDEWEKKFFNTKINFIFLNCQFSLEKTSFMFEKNLC